jgi:hypothetical protein
VPQGWIMKKHGVTPKACGAIEQSLDEKKKKLK